MSLHPNSQLLVQTLEAMPILDGRYERIKLVNFDAVAGKKRGCFSLVFEAHDVISNKKVALKFYDLDPTWTTDQYRILAFQREHEILEGLRTVDRCLQLASGLTTYELQIPIPNSPHPAVIACRYFAIEWLDDEIDDFFFDEKHSPAEKLKIFNEILLAVEALHNRKVFHRDLKADNLRATARIPRRVVVAIDLGTAARIDSGAIQQAYGRPVGARGYASPEAICGLAGHRALGQYNDLYALGCLLFELFNKDYFYLALRAKNQVYDVMLAAMGRNLLGVTDQAKQLKEWQQAVKLFGNGITPVSINGPGSNVPAGIVPILDEVLTGLTNIDYAKRPALSQVRQKVWSAIRTLDNQKAYEKRLEQNREQRRRKEARIRKNEQRLADAMANRRLPC